MFRLSLNESDVDRIIQNMLFDIVGLADDGFEMQFGIFTLKLVGQRGKDMCADGNAGANTQGAGRIPVLHFLFHLLK